jgi:hypothetical protein
MSYFYIQVDISDVEKELDRIIDGPNVEDILEFEAVLASQFQITQQAVHVITGSLRNSGHPSSVASADKWEGKIVYGGPSIGFPHNPVKYAHYEQERDGAHDYMQAIYALDSQYGNAVESWMKGGAV